MTESVERLNNAGFDILTAANAIFLLWVTNRIHLQLITAAASLNEAAGKYLDLGFNQIAVGLLGSVDLMIGQMNLIGVASGLAATVGLVASYFALYNAGKVLVSTKQ